MQFSTSPAAGGRETLLRLMHGERRQRTTRCNFVKMIPTKRNRKRYATRNNYGAPKIRGFEMSNGGEITQGTRTRVRPIEFTLSKADASSTERVIQNENTPLMSGVYRRQSRVSKEQLGRVRMC